MRASRGEIKIEGILSQNDVNFKEEYEIPGLSSPNGRALRFDFAVFDDEDNLDFLIEYQGKQHYQPVSKFGGSKGFYQQQFNDTLKRRWCAKNHVTLVEIPYTDEHLITYDYIMQRAYGD